MTGRERMSKPQRLPGGCEDCNAFRTLDASQAPLYRVTVHHDETCPSFRAMKGRRGR